MKLRIASDIHLEFYNLKEPVDPRKDIWHSHVLPIMEDEDEQTLVLAGDIFITKSADYYRPFFDKLSERFKRVIIIPGNHEHYGAEFFETLDFLESYFEEWDNIHFLDNSHIELEDDVVVFGATMWTDFKDGTDMAGMRYAPSAMADFKVINYANGFFSPADSIKEHQITKHNLEEFFEEFKDKKTVVVTHHAPSFESSLDVYKGTLLNSAFASSMEPFIMKHNPLLWIHGHMHNNSDYMIGDTRIICNPYGYEFKEENSEHFNKKLVVDIP